MKVKFHSRRGAPWTARERGLLGRVPDSVLARRTGRTIKEVVTVREARRIALPTGPRRWTARETSLLGRFNDTELARRLRRARHQVARQRRSLHIPPFKPRPKTRRWKRHEEKLLGTMPDKVLAWRLGVRTWVVSYRRRQLGVKPAPRGHPHAWTEAELALLGTKPDAEIARRLHRSVQAVGQKRLKQGIPAVPDPNAKFRPYSEEEGQGRRVRFDGAQPTTYAGSKMRKGLSLKSFTLIELLVVIAIISILAALLLPSLSKAKNQAGKATDLNNLKQIMTAVHLYCSDNGDVLVSPNWDNGGGRLPGWLYTPNAGGQQYNREAGLLWPTLRSPRLYVCPADNVEMSRYCPRHERFEQRWQRLSSYAMNGAVIGYSYAYEHTHPPVRLAQMLPGDCAFWETDETQPDFFNDGANYPPEGVSGRHTQGGIQATFDGAVSYIKLAQWYREDVTNAVRNRLWCYPATPDGHASAEYPTP